LENTLKKITFLIFMSFCLTSQATTSQSINVESLNLQKNYLKSINQCASEKTFLPFIKSAVKDANTFYAHGNYAQTIEETIVQNPACFVASTNKLTQRECQALNDQYIREPFFYPRALLSDSLSRVKIPTTHCVLG